MGRWDQLWASPLVKHKLQSIFTRSHFWNMNCIVICICIYIISCFVFVHIAPERTMQQIALAMARICPSAPWVPPVKQLHSGSGIFSFPPTNFLLHSRIQGQQIRGHFSSWAFGVACEDGPTLARDPGHRQYSPTLWGTDPHLYSSLPPRSKVWPEGMVMPQRLHIPGSGWRCRGAYQRSKQRPKPGSEERTTEIGSKSMVVENQTLASSYSSVVWVKHETRDY